MNIEFDSYKISRLDTSKSEAFFSLIDRNRPQLEDFFAGTVAKTLTLKDTQDYCALINDKVEEKSYFPYIISDANSGHFVGLVDVKNIDWNVPKAELGYFIDASYSGKSITSKALGLVVDYLINTYKFKKLLCRIGSKNLGSIRVAIKNEFQLEGVIRKDYKTTKGEIVDLNYYGRVFNFEIDKSSL